MKTISTLFMGFIVLAGFIVAMALGAPTEEDTQPDLPQDNLAQDLFSQKAPYGLPELETMEGDSQAIFDLGRSLFFDPMLSKDHSVSCASCHPPNHGFASAEARPMGAEGHRAKRSAPTLINRGYGLHQMWDGRADGLLDQVLRPISDEDEMRLPLEEALSRLEASSPYRRQFSEAFGEGSIDESKLARALTSFVRRLTLGDSPIDRFRAGLGGKLKPAERSGLWVFESKGQCWRCHSGSNFSDESFHNTGIGADLGEPQDGRWFVTQNEEDRGRFKTPTLRGLTSTAPYMHDGSLATLRDVIEFYRKGGEANSNLDPHMHSIDMSDTDVSNLVAFLEALSRVSDEPLSEADGDENH